MERTVKHYNNAAHGTTQRYQVKALHKDGSVVYVDVTNMPIVIENKIVGVYGIANDITDRQKEHDELRKTKERLESVVRNNADAIWVIDLEDRVLEINLTFETLFGWSAESIVGKQLPTIPDFLKDSIHEKVKKGVSVVGLETSRLCRYGSLNF